MSQQQAFKANMSAIVSAIPAETMKDIGATNIKPVSERTLQIDLKTPKPDGTNRLKITVEDGKFMVRGYKLEETDILHSIEPDSLMTAIAAIGNVVIPTTPKTY